MPFVDSQIYISLMTAVVLLFALMPYIERRFWWIRAFDFVRIQGFVLAVVLLLVSPFFLDALMVIDYVMLALIVACLTIQFYYLFPYTEFANRDVADFHKKDCQARFTLMLSNVLMKNEHYTALIDLVKQQQPDVLVCMETNQHWHDALQELNADYPHRISQPNERMYGMHVLSKFPMSDIQINHLVQDFVPSVHVCLDIDGSQVLAHFMHPAPPSPSENEESTERDAELLALARKLNGMTEPLLMAGDLNDVPWSKPLRAFKRISGLHDVRVGRCFLNTFHAAIPVLRWPLDHVFVSRHFQLINIQRHKLKGSDHFSVTAELALVTDEALEDNKSAQQEDQSYAEEVMAEENISEQDVPK